MIKVIYKAFILYGMMNRVMSLFDNNTCLEMEIVKWKHDKRGSVAGRSMNRDHNFKSYFDDKTACIIAKMMGIGAVLVKVVMHAST